MSWTQVLMATVGFLIGFLIARVTRRSPSTDATKRCGELRRYDLEQGGTKVGTATKRCDLDAGHSGPHHVRRVTGTVYEPFTGQRIVYDDDWWQQQPVTPTKETE